jgi:hypothetical protein
MSKLCTEDDESCKKREKCVARVRRSFDFGIDKLPNPLAVDQCVNEGDFDYTKWEEFKKNNKDQTDEVKEFDEERNKGGKRRKKSTKRKVKSLKKARRKYLKRKKTCKKKH